MRSSQRQVAAAHAAKLPHDLVAARQRQRVGSNNRQIATLARLESKRIPGIRRPARHRERPSGVSRNLAERIRPRVGPKIDHERARLLVLDRQHDVRENRPRRRGLRALIRGAARQERERRAEQGGDSGYGSSSVVA